MSEFDFIYDVYLSHSAKDKGIVRELAERLRNDGVKIWFDEWEIGPGDNIPAKTEHGLERSRVLIFCMSANAFGADWTQLEAGTFRFRDPLNRQRRLIPLRLDNAPIEGSLAQFNYINWLAPNTDQEYAKLIRVAMSPNVALRSMLVPISLGRPTKDSRFVVASSPLSWRRAMGRSGGYKSLRRTSSDYVGIRGILQAFGFLYDFDTLPDTIDPEDYDESVIQEAMNVYCIASPKANRWTGDLLKKYWEKWVPKIEFKACPSSKSLQNVKVSLYSDDDLLHPAGWKINVDGDREYRDFGIIIRGPNPYHPLQMSAILAGRSSLGTEAACLAFTNSKIISDIARELSGKQIDIENHAQAFWVLVSMKRNCGDGKEEANSETLRLERVGKFRDF